MNSGEIEENDMSRKKKRAREDLKHVHVFGMVLLGDTIEDSSLLVPLHREKNWIVMLGGGGIHGSDGETGTLRGLLATELAAETGDRIVLDDWHHVTRGHDPDFYAEGWAPATVAPTQRPSLFYEEHYESKEGSKYGALFLVPGRAWRTGEEVAAAASPRGKDLPAAIVKVPIERLRAITGEPNRLFAFEQLVASLAETEDAIFYPEDAARVEFERWGQSEHNARAKRGYSAFIEYVIEALPER